MSAACTLYEIEYQLIYLLDTLEGLLPEEGEARLELEEAIAKAVHAEIQKVDGISHLLAHFESPTRRLGMQAIAGAEEGLRAGWGAA
jgi:hypothetical protein